MNKSNVAARNARSRSSAAEARLRQNLLDLQQDDEVEAIEELDAAQAPAMAPILELDEDWTDAEAGESDINLLLRGYR